jgi:hypothetical protein
MNGCAKDFNSDWNANSSNVDVWMEGEEGKQSEWMIETKLN